MTTLIPPESSILVVAGVVSNNDLPFQNQSNQTKIDVIENSVYSAYELQDDILCVMELV